MLECNVGNGRQTKRNSSTGITATVDLLPPVLMMLHKFKRNYLLTHADIYLLIAHIVQKAHANNHNIL